MNFLTTAILQLSHLLSNTILIFHETLPPIIILGFQPLHETSCQELIDNSNNETSDASNIVNIGGFRYGTYKVLL